MQYDIALNGWELGGGSVRIHKRELLERSFALQGYSLEKMHALFGGILEAFDYGAPPHGGIAMGIDRWAALFAYQTNIREVMAFPKTQSGTDLMLEAPSPPEAAQYSELGLRFVGDRRPPTNPGRSRRSGRVIGEAAVVVSQRGRVLAGDEREDGPLRTLSRSLRRRRWAMHQVRRAPTRPPVAAPKVAEGSFVERYAGSEFVTRADPPAAPMSQRRENHMLWIGGGAALIVAAVVVAIILAMGLGGTSNQPNGRLVAMTPRPTPTPTLPPSITALMGHLNDSALSAHIVVVSRVQVSTRLIGSGTTLISFDGQISGSNESGTLKQGGVSREIKLVDSIVYTRAVPNGTWQISPSIASYLIIAPVFGITKPEMIQLIDQEAKNGQMLNHLQTTKWWAPDPSRLALADLTRLSLAPDVNVLDLWATADGVPVSATFSGTNSASDGTKLVDIEVSYTFDQVGMPISIGTPEPPAAPTKK